MTRQDKDELYLFRGRERVARQDQDELYLFRGRERVNDKTR